MNKNNRFGIISGAGPMAGNFLYQRVIEKLQEQGAWHDADFPEIILINVPFSEMLLGETDNDIVRSELIQALHLICPLVNHVYIACQTLHAFLTEEDLIKYKVVNLLSLTKKALSNQHINSVLVVASKTSIIFDLHPKMLQMPCQYIENHRSEATIEDVLRGKKPNLDWLEQLAIDNVVILGCTEFSVAAQTSTVKFIDPIELAANDIIDKFNFKKQSQSCIPNSLSAIKTGARSDHYMVG